MNSYERALASAGDAPLSIPDFDAIAKDAARDRGAWTHEGQAARARARQWFFAAALVWLLLPLDALSLARMPGSDWALAAAFNVALSVLPAPLISIWGARLTRNPRFQAAILVRAIAASNLVVALLYAMSVGGMFGALFSTLLALASGRSLQLLGDRGLDGADDPSTRFEPIRFRGVLILALIMAFADTLTLLFSCSIKAVQALAFSLSSVEANPAVGISLILTAAATSVMAVNVWGLLRLRTWALVSNMVSNIGIAGLALAGLLGLNPYVSTALAVTAGIQLLLPVPILAAALGDDEAGRSHARFGKLVHLVIPALIVATVVFAALNFGPGLPHDWLPNPLSVSR